MKTTQQAETRGFYSNFISYLLSEAKAKIYSPQSIKNLSLLASYANRTLSPSFLKLYRLWSECTNFLSEVMQRILAPLRRIVTRELEVLTYDRIHTDKPQSFLIHSTLECGHVSTSFAWDIFDLLDGYTLNPAVSAKRHRCRPCASLLATKKPVQSVALAAKAGAA